jgi:hypothetical protein
MTNNGSAKTTKPGAKGDCLDGVRSVQWGVDDDWPGYCIVSQQKRDVRC